MNQISKPDVSELRNLEIRAAFIQNKNRIHEIESIIRWMDDLLRAPVWSDALQTLWSMYQREINKIISGQQKV